MPQNRKQCTITINHNSYLNMEKIFKLYNEPHLKNILAQQIAYNCAIRKAFIDGMFTNPLYKDIQNLGEYGLDTYIEMNVFHPQDNSDTPIAKHSFDNLHLDYPFIHETNEDTIAKNLTHYPNVQKPLNDGEKEQISLMLEDSSNVIFPIRNNLQPQLPFNDKSPKKLADYLTRAFYFFDAEHFYNYTPSMLSRDEHDQRTIKKLRNTIEPYIIDFKYIELI